MPPQAHAFDFDKKLEGEEAVLDAILLTLGRSNLRAETWDALHKAAQRDERVSELAFAYESVAQGKRLKTMTPGVLAEFLYRAATFFSDVLGDDFGAISYFERSLAAQPAHAPAFERLEALLTKAGDLKAVAELYAAGAPHRPRPEQLAMLRRAAELYEKVPGGEDKSVEIYQQVNRLDPGDEQARNMLEARYLRANRHRDVARLLEQALAIEPPIPEAEALRLRARLIELYAGHLHEPERTMPHIEAVLAKDPTHDDARRVAVKLLGVKGLAARAAAALADATENDGLPREVARYLEIELEHTRGPKRATVLRRIGVLKQEKLEDLEGAYDAFEQALALDPSDDDVRLRYGSLAFQLGRVLDAARTLQRVGAAARESHVRARLTAEMGELYRLGGDAKKAKATFVGVLAAPSTDAMATLKSARALAEIYEAEQDHRALAEVLARIAEVDPDADKKRLANEKLAELAFRVLKDPPRAIEAWQKLVDTPSRARALTALEPLYEAAGKWTELASVLEERAKDATNPREARVLYARAAEVLTTKTQETQRASDAWKHLVEKYGASREVFAQWMPLAESLKQWPELADALAADAQLAPEAERAGIYARLALVRLQRTREVELAIDAFRRALAADPSEKTSRASLEKMLDAPRGGQGDHRLAAANVLEPIYRAEGSTQGLLRVLEVKSLLGATVAERIGALEEATYVAESSPMHASRAIDLAGRGLAEAVAADAPLGPWLERLARVAGTDGTSGHGPGWSTPGTDSKRRATLLSKALGERTVDSAELVALARTAGEALAECGEVAAALATFRRALAFEPSNAELLTRVDELLRDQGSPSERVALYRAALERGEGASTPDWPRRRRELLHAIGALERGELGDLASAIDAYRTALASDPDDLKAHSALAELYAQTGDWAKLCDLLEGHVDRVAPDEARRTRAQLAEVAAAHGQPDRARAQSAALIADAEAGAAELDAVERVAQVIGDRDLEAGVLERRAREAADPRDQVAWLERLAVVLTAKTADPKAGAETYRRAGRVAAGAGDEDAARALFAKVRAVFPEDLEATSTLADLCERAGDWGALPELFGILLAHAVEGRPALLMRVARVRAERLGDLAGAVDAAAEAFAIDPRDREVLSAFERVAVAAGAARRFARAMDEAIAGAPDDGQRAEFVVDLRLAKGRALAADPACQSDAAAAYREVLEADGVEEARSRLAIAAFEALLAAREGAPEALADRRWLCEWRYARAAEADRVHALLAWAQTEESVLHDVTRSLDLYRKVLELDAENAEALGAVARLAIETGDVDGAIRALVAQRDRAAGQARARLDLEIASILLDRTERLDEALASVASVLEVAPNDETALGLASRLLAVPATRARAVEMLEKAFDLAESYPASGGDDGVRGRILECLLGDESAPPERRRDWYERLLDLLERHGREHDAYAVVLRAVEQMPGIPALWDRAEALARALQQPDDIGALYQRALALPMERDDALELGKRAVAFYEEWFEDTGRVVRILERILEIDPAESWAFDRLKLLFDAAERWDDLFTLYDRALLVADAQTKIALLEDAAQIAKDFANHSKRAIGYLEQLLALKPNNARLSSSLERLYERHGCHRELISLLASQLARQGHKEAQETRARIAALWLDQLGDATNALVMVEDMLAREAEQHTEQASSDGASTVRPWTTPDMCGLLERIVSNAPPHAEMRDSTTPPPVENERANAPRRDSIPPVGGPKRTLVRQRAAGLLRERYAEQGLDADLVRILEVELEAVKNSKERIRRHQQIAKLYEQLGNDARALDHYGTLVLLEPDVGEHRAKLAGIAGRIGRFDRLAEVLVAAADDCTDDTLRVDLLMQAGIVHADDLRDADRAIDLFFRILHVSPISEHALYKACRRIEPLLATAGRVRERLDVLERLALIEPEEPARRDVLATAARLAMDLGENDRAIWAWETLLEIFPTDADALNGLVDLLGGDKRWRRLIEVLRLRAAAALPGGDSRADSVRVATILAGELGETDEAIASWREVERAFGESDDSTRALIALLQGAQRWAELAALLERAAARAQGADGGRAALLRELGDVQREHLDAAGAAVASYGAALQVDPREEGARAGLHALLAGEHRAAAVGVLLDAYRTCDEWRHILDLTEARLSVAADSAARIAILLEAATAHEERASDPEAAFWATRRAFLLDPGSIEVENRLTRLAAETRQWRSLAEAQREGIEAREASGEAPQLAGLRFRMGDVLENKLDDPRAALAAYQRVAQDAPTDLEAARATVRVAARVMRWDAAAKVVLESSRARAEERLVPTLVDAVEEAASTPGAWDAATAAFAAAVGERGGLPAMLARDVEGTIAHWHRDRRGDPDAAESAFVRALAYDASNAELLTELTQLQRRAKGRPLVESLLRLSSATGGDLDLLREAAEITTSSVGDRSLAKSILERMLKLGVERWVGSDRNDGPVSLGSPGSPSAAVEWALRELVRIHDEEGDLERIIELLVETARLPFERATARGMRHDAARISAERLGDRDRAIALYAALFDEDPDDARAVERLASLYGARGQNDELLALKRKQIATAKSAEKRIALRLEAAPIQVQIGDLAGCIATLRENLVEEARHPATVQELIRIFEREGRHEELADLLASQATRAEEDGDRGEAADLWARAAAVAEEQLRDVGRAIAHHGRVIAIEERAPSLDALARLSMQRRDHDGAAGYLERLHAAAPQDARPEIVQRLAAAYVAAGKDDVARARLEAAVEASPEVEALRARLAEMYREKSDFKSLAALLTKGAAHAPDKATTLARLREAADLHIATSDPKSAIPLLEQASDLEPDDRAIRLSLGDALGAAGRFDEARALLRALIDGFAGRRPKERAPVHYHLARLDLAVGDRGRALVELDQATKIDPANPEILRALAELARDDGQLDRAERSYRALLAVLRRSDAATGGDGAPIVTRSEVLLELSSIADRQGEGERAKEILESALEIAATSDQESRRLEAWLRKRGDYTTLTRALETRLARDSVPPATVAEGLSELADVLENHLGRRDDALAARLRAVKLSPRSATVHDAAVALARSERQITRYVDHLAELAGAAEAMNDADLACELLLRMGAVVENEMRDDRRAAAIYERAEKHGGRPTDVLRALDRVYERVGDEAAQARAIAARVELEQREGRLGADPLYRLAALRLRGKSAPAEGCALLVQALEREPDSARAEEIMRTAAAAHPRDARVVELYERVARQSGRDGSLVDALAKRWRLGGGEETIREAIMVAERVGDGTAEALLNELLGRGNDVDVATRAWALAALSDLKLAAGDLRAAVDCKRAAAEIAEPDDARRFRFDVARLATDNLRDLGLAAATYEQLHEREPADREAWEPLASVYRSMASEGSAESSGADELGGEERSRAARTEAAQKLAALLGKVAEYVEEPSERSRLRAERVKVMVNDLGMKDEDAIPALREIVDDDPAQLDAAHQLASILERIGREEELAELLARQLDGAKDRNDAASVASISRRLGALLEKRDPMEAKNVYYAGLDWAPQSRELLEALVQLHSNGGESSDRADVMERLLALEQGSAAEARALELAQIRADAWDEEGAMRALEIGFHACPTSSELRDRLEASYRDRSAWPKLAELAAVDARARTSADEKVARLREAAAIFRNELNEPARGASVLREAREIAPSDPALLDELVETLTAAGEHASAAEELSKAIEALGAANHPALPTLLAHRARVRDRLNDDAGALDDMELAYTAGGSAYARDLASYLDRFATHAAECGDGARARTLRLRLAEILPIVGDPDAARAILSELLKLDAKDKEALRALALLEEVAERWDGASAAYRRLVALEDGEEVVDTALRLADACERAGRLTDARGGLERARHVAPQNVALRRRLEMLYEHAGAFRELAEMSLEDAKSSLDVGGRFGHLMRAGALFLQQGGDPQVAVAPLEEAHALRPADIECISRLADAYLMCGRLTQAAELVTGTVAQHKGRRSREQSPLYHRLAKVSHAIGDFAQELAHLNAALDMDSQNGAVANDLAEAAMAQGQMDLATRALRAITMLKTTTTASKALAYQHLGEIARRQGDRKRALVLVKRAVDEDPSLASAQALLDEMEREN